MPLDPARSEEIRLTTASQSLLRRERLDDFDPPSPMTVDDEGEADENEIEEDREEDIAGDDTVSGGQGRSPCAILTIPGLDIALEAHQRYPVPTERTEAYLWTEKQRSLAQNALTPSSLEELEYEVSAMCIIIP